MPIGRDEDCLFCRLVGGTILVGSSAYIFHMTWKDRQRWRNYGRLNILYSAGALTFAGCMHNLFSSCPYSSYLLELFLSFKS